MTGPPGNTKSHYSWNKSLLYNFRRLFFLSTSNILFHFFSSRIASEKFLFWPYILFLYKWPVLSFWLLLRFIYFQTYGFFFKFLRSISRNGFVGFCFCLSCVVHIVFLIARCSRILLILEIPSYNLFEYYIASILSWNLLICMLVLKFFFLFSFLLFLCLILGECLIPIFLSTSCLLSITFL